MTIAGKTAWTVAAIHFALVVALAAYIARQTRYEGETPMLWLLLARFDIPAYLAMAPFGSRILAMPHVSWVEHLTGEWITGEWEPFLAPLITFAILGTAWWLFLGWLAGRLWMLIRPHV